MEGKRLLIGEMGEIRKGPWNAEEDEVLINHVKKYGPRDWSSIRSKGLLQRTGKSCRLRWVNKLRPNLKNGVKFSAEEERVVIELQGQFGNKWARIATYLPGRTDNDVKNFWSSRQKRLSRILQTPPPPPSRARESCRNTREVRALHEVSSIEAPKFISSTEESCSLSSYLDNSRTMKMVPLPGLVVSPNSLTFEHNVLQLSEFAPVEEKTVTDSQPQFSPFPRIPQLDVELPLTLERQELASRLDDPNFLDTVGSEELQLPYMLPCLKSCQNGERRENEEPTTPESFINEFPMDIFNALESLPSPSEW